MAFLPIKNADQGLLDWLWERDQKLQGKPCHDCGAKPGENHDYHCDTAQCPVHKIQALQAPCDECDQNPCEVIWDGIWPGIWECYKLGLVTFDTATNMIMFDLNEWHRKGCPSVEDDDLDIIKKVPLLWLEEKPERPRRGDTVFVERMVCEELIGHAETFDGQKWVKWERGMSVGG